MRNIHSEDSGEVYMRKPEQVAGETIVHAKIEAPIRNK